MSAKSRDFAGTKDWAIGDMPKFPAGARAYVLPGAFYGAIVTLMAEAGFAKADSVEKADVVVFAGGADIDPALYDEKNVAAGGINKTRDALEKDIYHQCVAAGKIMFGICRGAQFLHAMNGGKLWQDVNNHGGSSHNIVDLDEDVRVLATSIHHQMLQENDTMELIAICEDQIGTRFVDAELDINLKMRGSNGPPIIEVEAGAYPATKCFFVQGHPEIGSRLYQTWTMHKLHDFYNEWSTRTDVPNIIDIVKGMGA